MDDQPTHPITYRDWTIHLRADDGVANAAIVSPYDELTVVVTAPSEAAVLERAEAVVDHVVAEHYPEGPLGRYTPPTGFVPKPGQPHGLTLQAGAQRLPDAMAREVVRHVEHVNQ